MNNYPGLPARKEEDGENKPNLRYELWCCKWPIITTAGMSLISIAWGIECAYLSMTHQWWRVRDNYDPGPHATIFGLGCAFMLFGLMLVAMASDYHYRFDHRRRYEANFPKHGKGSGTK